MKTILVTCYVSPDLDGTAGTVAYGEFLQKTGKNIFAGIIGEIHEEAKYIFDRFGFGYPEKISDAADFDEVILVDASELSGLNGKISPEKVIEIIDHRKINEADKFPNAKSQIEFVGAAATLVAEKFMQSEVGISKESATLLCGAIISNTLNFKAAVTTDRDISAFEFLNKVAGLDENFWRELFEAKSDLTGDKLAEGIEGDFANFVFVGDKKVGIAQLEIIGARKLINSRENEIVDILEKIKSKNSFDYLFQTIIELEEFKNYFIAPDAETRNLLEKVLGIKFVGNVAVREGMIMRKEIVPLLKQELEN